MSPRPIQVSFILAILCNGVGTLGTQSNVSDASGLEPSQTPPANTTPLDRFKHYSDIFDLRSFDGAIRLSGAIEWRWVGDKTMGDSWTHDHS